MENIGLGLELLVVGMCTVFVILLIVIWGGGLLIRLVNRIAPEVVAPTKKAQTSASPSATVDAKDMAVLEEAVRQLTQGKGHIASARRL